MNEIDVKAAALESSEKKNARCIWCKKCHRSYNLVSAAHAMQGNYMITLDEKFAPQQAYIGAVSYV